MEISASVALYGLLIFYDLTKRDLEGKRPLAKFWCIKLVIIFTFYQSFIVSTRGWVEHPFTDPQFFISSRHWKAEYCMVFPCSFIVGTSPLMVIATQFWTATNISNAL